MSKKDEWDVIFYYVWHENPTGLVIVEFCDDNDHFMSQIATDAILKMESMIPLAPNWLDRLILA